MCGFVSGLVGVDDLVDRRLGQDDGRGFMSAIYVISAVVAAGLLIYLVVALLKPEWF